MLYLKCKTMKRSFIIFGGWAANLLVMAVSSQAKAQTTDPQTPYQERVVVVAPYQPVLEVARKPLLQPGPMADSAKKIDSAVYEIITRPVQTTYPVENIKPAKVAGEPVERLFHQHLKLGIGYPLSPLAEAYVAMGRSQQYGVAASYKHHSIHSPQNHSYIKGYDSINSDYSYDEADLSGEIFTKKFKARLELNYRQNKVNAYGIHDSVYDYLVQQLNDDNDFRKIYRDQPVRWFQNMDGRLSITDRATDPDAMRYDAQLYYNFGRNNWHGVENIIETKGQIYKRLAPRHENADHIDVGARWFFGDYIHRPHQDDKADNAYLLRLEPMLNYRHGIFDVQAALCFQVFGDVRNGNKFQFNPNVRLNVQAVPEALNIYVGMEGRVKRNTIMAISEINPFLHPLDPTDLAFSREKYYLYLGLKSNLSKEIDFSLTASCSWLGNYMSFDYFYYAYSYRKLAFNDFKPVYTDKVFKAQGKGEVNVHWGDALLAHVEAEYNYYNQNLLYTPAFKAGLMFRYDIGQKFIVTTQLSGYSNMKAHDREGKEVSLKGGIDWNAGLEYRFFKRWSAFAYLNNLIGYRSYKWYDYPTYRFNAMMGITFSF